MLRSEFAKLLESTIIPEGIEQEDIKSRIYPISAALMSMLPQKLYRYRSCSTLNLDAFDKDWFMLLLLISLMTPMTLLFIIVWIIFKSK